MAISPQRHLFDCSTTNRLIWVAQRLKQRLSSPLVSKVASHPDGALANVGAGAENRAVTCCSVLSAPIELTAATAA